MLLLAGHQSGFLILQQWMLGEMKRLGDPDSATSAVRTRNLNSSALCWRAIASPISGKAVSSFKRKIIFVGLD